MSQKKKIEAEVWLGYYPFCTGSRYSKLYRDTRQLGAARGAIIRSGRLAWPGVTRPRYGPVRTTWLLSQDKVLYCVRGGLRHGKPRRYNTAPQRTHVHCDTTGRCLRYGQRGYDTTPMRHDTATTRPMHACDTTTIQSRRGATIWPNARHDTTLCARPRRCLHAA